MEQEARNAERREQYEARHAKERRNFMERLEKRHEKFHTVPNRPHDVHGCNLLRQADMRTDVLDDCREVGEAEVATRQMLSHPNRLMIAIDQAQTGVEPPSTESKPGCLPQPGTGDFGA